MRWSGRSTPSARPSPAGRSGSGWGSAIARGAGKAALARELGAHHYIDSRSEDPVAALQALGGARVILATASDSKSMSALIGGLAPRGRMIVVGAGSDPIEVIPSQLL